MYAHGQTYFAAARGEAQGVVDQVAQGTAQQGAVGVERGNAIDRQPYAGILGQGREILGEQVQFFAHLQWLAPCREQAVVSLGQQEHVVDHLCQVLQFLQVRVQRLAVVGLLTWLAEDYLGLGQQIGERCAQFVGDIGGEGGEAGEGFFQSREHCIERVDQVGQFTWRVA